MKTLSVKTSAIFLCLSLKASPAWPEEVLVYSIADEIYSQNDCSDPNNSPCSTMFQSTCNWVGESAKTIARGLERNIPPDRIHNRILGDLVEIGEGSGGFVDLDLANSFIDPLWNYFSSGQYQLDFANTGGNSGIGLGLIFAGEASGQFEKGATEQYLQSLAEKQQEELYSIWMNSCLETAYDGW